MWWADVENTLNRASDGPNANTTPYAKPLYFCSASRGKPSDRCRNPDSAAETSPFIHCERVSTGHTKKRKERTDVAL